MADTIGARPVTPDSRGPLQLTVPVRHADENRRISGLLLPEYAHRPEGKK